MIFFNNFNPKWSQYDFYGVHSLIPKIIIDFLYKTQKVILPYSPIYLGSGLKVLFGNKWERRSYQIPFRYDKYRPQKCKN